jgi:hypothetical protein
VDLALAKKVSKVKRLRLRGIGMVANWLARRVIPLRKQVHPGCEYNRISDTTCETNHHLKNTQLSKLLSEILQSTDSWPTLDQVCTFHIQTIHDAVSRFIQLSFQTF